MSLSMQLCNMEDAAGGQEVLQGGVGDEMACISSNENKRVSVWATRLQQID